MSEAPKSRLKQVGFFRELRHGDPHGPSLMEARGGLSHENRAAILHYLRSASILCVAACLFDDALDSSRQSIDNLAIATDGEWKWPTDLPYYVERYEVAIPEEFLAHIQANGWRPPSLSDDELIRIAEAHLAEPHADMPRQHPSPGQGERDGG
jgi:hypothetical protein